MRHANRARRSRPSRPPAKRAGLDRAIEVEDRQVGARPTERKPATRVTLVEVRRTTAVFALALLGADDLERGSIATVYLGLGVLAANAARQNHAVLEGQGEAARWARPGPAPRGRGVARDLLRAIAR